jgi:acylpyruvate hydrolase
LLKDNKPFYHPDWSSDIHYEAELVLRVCKQGKYIEPQFAHKYYDEVTVGIDFTARDIQALQKEKRLPWEIAKAFDGSAVVGVMASVSQLGKNTGFDFSLHLNGTEVQRANTDEMLFSFEQIIAYASRYFTLQVGDLIYTGTPSGVGAVKIGDRLAGYLAGTMVFDIEVK